MIGIEEIRRREENKMEKLFKLEWPDKYGPEWMNKYNLELCLFSGTFISNVKVVVEEVVIDKD